MIRECLGFGSNIDRESSKKGFKVGVMACSPLGDGTEATFQAFSM
jgi:regulation of enolase protein 1 (concanavalin A-like superfamily)